MTSRKKPGVAFWATVVVVVVLMYPISFGPACWLANRGRIPMKPVAIVYGPLVDRGIENRSYVERSLLWYATVFCKEKYSPFATNILFTLRDERAWN